MLTRLAYFLKNHILGMTLFALGTSIAATWVYDRFLTPKSQHSSLWERPQQDTQPRVVQEAPPSRQTSLSFKPDISKQESVEGRTTRL